MGGYVYPVRQSVALYLSGHKLMRLASTVQHEPVTRREEVDILYVQANSLATRPGVARGAGVSGVSRAGRIVWLGSRLAWSEAR
jgi:hypothetical protein